MLFGVPCLIAIDAVSPVTNGPSLRSHSWRRRLCTIVSFGRLAEHSDRYPAAYDPFITVQAGRRLSKRRIIFIFRRGRGAQMKRFILTIKNKHVTVFTRRKLLSSPTLPLIGLPLLSVAPQHFNNASLRYGRNSCHFALKIGLCCQQFAAEGAPSNFADDASTNTRKEKKNRSYGKRKL